MLYFHIILSFTKVDYSFISHIYTCITFNSLSTNISVDENEQISWGNKTWFLLIRTSQVTGN